MNLILFQAAPSSVPGPSPGGPLAAGPADPALETVGLALLAYGLVQLLSRVLDRLLTTRDGKPDHPSSLLPGFRDDDRKRLEKTFAVLTADRERLRRMEDAISEIHEQTRWLAEQRTHMDPVDGLPLWNCRARGLGDQLNVQQRLAEQLAEEIRGLTRQNETMLRRLRSLWKRIGRWRG